MELPPTIRLRPRRSTVRDGEVEQIEAGVPPGRVSRCPADPVECAREGEHGSVAVRHELKTEQLVTPEQLQARGWLESQHLTVDER